MLTREELDRLSELERKVSPPTWEYKHGTVVDHWELWSKYIDECQEDYVWEVQDDSGVEPSTEFLEFITQSRNALPALLKMARMALEAKEMAEFYASSECKRHILQDNFSVIQNRAREWLKKFERIKNVGWF